MRVNHSTILIVDDEVEILRLTRHVLETEDFTVITAENGEAAINILMQETIDLVLLDLMMPGIDGIDVCRYIRLYSTMPIIILTAKGNDDEKVVGLDAGADDYLTKPFSPQELLARIRAVLRRSHQELFLQSEQKLVCGTMKIDFTSRRVEVSGQEVKLTPIEYNLLQVLAQGKGKVLTHTYLLQRVWGNEYALEKKYLHVFINRLRNKLNTNKSPGIFIENIVGVGYRLNPGT